MTEMPDNSRGSRAWSVRCVCLQASAFGKLMVLDATIIEMRSKQNGQENALLFGSTGTV
jgi:hypothetical protein